MLRKRDTQVLELSQKEAWIGAFHYALSGAADARGIAAIQTILESGGDSRLFMTPHFMYGRGARIITLANRKPLSIIYKEIRQMQIRLD